MVDIIIPIYKVEPYLQECVDSVLNQTYKNINIILVDDGSPDRCGKICDDYAKRFPNVQVLHKPNGGLSDARNKGMELASAEYIMFLDSDDWIEAEMIEVMMNHVLQEQLDFIACPSVMNFDNQESILPHNSCLELLDAKQTVKKILNRKMNVSAWGKIYKRSLFEGISYPYGCLHEDIPVIFELTLKCNRVGFLDTPYHHYRQQGGSISRSMYSKRNYDLYRFVKSSSFVLNSYPSLKVDYEGFYLYFVKSLLVLFGDTKTRNMFYRDFRFYKTILIRNWWKVVTNPTLSLKDKLSIPLLFSPWYNNIKRLIIHR